MADERRSPIPVRELGRRVKARDALTSELPRLPPQRRFIAAAGAGLEVATRQERVLRGGERGVRAIELVTEISGASIGTHVFGPAVKGTALPRRRKLLEPEDHANILQPFPPDHLSVRPTPAKLPRELRVPKRIDALAGPGVKRATTVFTPEDRLIFNDTAYPWSTVGRVDTAGGTATGVMVGPRHMITCSHAIDWLPAGSGAAAGWVKFTPSYFDGSEPFGVAWGVHIYWDVQVTGPTIDGTEEQHDYVSIVLDSRIGDLTGWMGVERYTDAWDGGTFWSHVGYPGDLASAARPSFQGGIALNGSDSQPDAHEVMTHQADVWPGQSGGPMFGWWDGEAGPRTVSVQSWENSSANGASGGSNMVDLAIRALNDFA